MVVMLITADDFKARFEHKFNLGAAVHVHTHILVLVSSSLHKWDTKSEPCSTLTNVPSPLFRFKLGHISWSVLETGIQVHGWSVRLRRCPLCQRWRGGWLPRSTPCQSSSRSGPSFQSPAFRKTKNQTSQRAQILLLANADDGRQAVNVSTHGSGIILLSRALSDEVTGIHALLDLWCSLSQTLVQVRCAADIDVIHWWKTVQSTECVCTVIFQMHKYPPE